MRGELGVKDGSGRRGITRPAQAEGAEGWGDRPEPPTAREGILDAHGALRPHSIKKEILAL